MSLVPSNTRIDFRRKKLLILECDSEKLSRQRMAVGTELSGYLRSFFPSNPIYLIKASDIRRFSDSIEQLYLDKLQIPSVVVVGHSDTKGIQLASDAPSVPWTELAQWISPLKSTQITLLACEAGGWLPCNDMFHGIPELDEIFASPVFARTSDKYLVFFKILSFLGSLEKELFSDHVPSLLNFAATGGIMFSRTRSEYEDNRCNAGNTIDFMEIINFLTSLLNSH